MTPASNIASPLEPLSRVTIGAVEDLYGVGSVDYSKADPWTCGARTEGASQSAGGLGSPEPQDDGVEVHGPLGSMPVKGKPVLAPSKAAVDPSA